VADGLNGIHILIAAIGTHTALLSLFPAGGNCKQIPLAPGVTLGRNGTGFGGFAHTAAKKLCARLGTGCFCLYLSNKAMGAGGYKVILKLVTAGTAVQDVALFLTGRRDNSVCKGVNVVLIFHKSTSSLISFIAQKL
jgi:hypothetical protein